MNFNAMVEQAVGRCLRLFYRREWFTATSRGDADRYRAVLLNEDGEIDPSMLDLSAYLLLAGRSGGQTIDDDVTINGIMFSNGFTFSNREAFRRRSGVISVSTSYVQLLNVSGRFAVVHVGGRSGSIYFQDLVLTHWFGGVVGTTVIGSASVGGSAPTRTYRDQSGGFQLQLSSGTYDVQATCISMIADP